MSVVILILVKIMINNLSHIYLPNYLYIRSWLVICRKLLYDICNDLWIFMLVSTGNFPALRFVWSIVLWRVLYLSWRNISANYLDIKARSRKRREWKRERLVKVTKVMSLIIIEVIGECVWPHLDSLRGNDNISKGKVCFPL